MREREKENIKYLETIQSHNDILEKKIIHAISCYDNGKLSIPNLLTKGISKMMIQS